MCYIRKNRYLIDQFIFIAFIIIFWLFPLVALSHLKMISNILKGIDYKSGLIFNSDFHITNGITIILFLFDFLLLFFLIKLFESKTKNSFIKKSRLQVLSVFIVISMGIPFILKLIIKENNTYIEYFKDLVFILGFIFWIGLFFIKREVLLTRIHLSEIKEPSQLFSLQEPTKSLLEFT